MLLRSEILHAVKDIMATDSRFADVLRSEDTLVPRSLPVKDVHPRLHKTNLRWRLLLVSFLHSSIDIHNYMLIIHSPGRTFSLGSRMESPQRMASLPYC